jgi:hypothetical protein
VPDVSAAFVATRRAAFGEEGRVGVPEWTLVGAPFYLSMGRDRSSEFMDGWLFRAVNSAGNKAEVRVLQLRHCSTGPLLVASARRALAPYLMDGDKPLPARLVRGADERFRPV